MIYHNAPTPPGAPESECVNSIIYVTWFWSNKELVGHNGWLCLWHKNSRYVAINEKEVGYAKKHFNFTYFRLEMFHHCVLICASVTTLTQKLASLGKTQLKATMHFLVIYIAINLKTQNIHVN